MKEQVIWKSASQEIRRLSSKLFELTVQEPKLQVFYGSSLEELTEKYKAWSQPIYQDRMIEWKKPKPKKKK